MRSFTQIGCESINSMKHLWFSCRKTGSRTFVRGDVVGAWEISRKSLQYKAERYSAGRTIELKTGE